MQLACCNIPNNITTNAVHPHHPCTAIYVRAVQGQTPLTLAVVNPDDAWRYSQRTLLQVQGRL